MGDPSWLPPMTLGWGFLWASLLVLQQVAALNLRGQHSIIKHPSELLSNYDFIIVGGGTAGLTIADRLTESGLYTVLVVEYGYLDDNPSILATGGDRANVPSNPFYPIGTQNYNITTLPISGLAGSQVQVMAAAVVGGSSAINGFAFDRGSVGDYDGWVWQSGIYDEFGDEWGWDNMLPWFRKSATFHPPSAKLAADLNITWDTSVWGNTTPLHVGFSPFQWKQQQVIFDALRNTPGIGSPREGAAGDAAGVFWFGNTINPSDQSRSYARTAHYDPVRSRANYHLLPGWRVTQVTLNRTDTDLDDKWNATGVLITPRDGDMPAGGPIKIEAKREVVVCAGTVHTPQVLQRSGIGPRDVIKAANGTVRVELPGVGFNLQDHMYFPINYTWKTPVYPDPTNLTTNATFAAEARAEWQANKTGPLSVHVNAAGFLQLPVVAENQSVADDILMAIQIQMANPFAYLPSNIHDSLVVGYVEQLKVLGQLYATPSSAIMEFPFSGNSLFYPIFLKPLSRGTVLLDPHDDGVSPLGRGNMEPQVDYRTRSNPLDVQVTAQMLKWVRRFMESPAIANTFHPVEVQPGPNVTSDEDIQRYIASTGTPGNGHPCGTARLGALDLGGVLAADLTVYGVRGLSVADASAIPLIPGAHTSATVYAIAEKAADLILKRAKAQ